MLHLVVKAEDIRNSDEILMKGPCFYACGEFIWSTEFLLTLCLAALSLTVQDFNFS
jgi:hypothetical protein